MTSRQRASTENPERGLLFVGIREIARLGGPDGAARVWDAIEAKRGGK
jgi:hypothetical protein